MDRLGAEKVGMVVVLLGALSDARDGWRSVDDGTRGRADSRDLWHGELWHSTCPRACRVDRDPRACRSVFAELERALLRMRKLGRQQAVDGVGLHRLYWHVREWYVDARVVIDREPVRVAVKGGGHRTVPKVVDGQVVTRPSRRIVRHPDAREAKALLGARWLAGEMRFVELPAELRPDAALVSRAA